MYENSFNKLTERYFKNQPWPAVELISPFVNNDTTFQLLYKELFFRHIYAKCRPTASDRVNSWINYCDLFDLFLDRESPVPLDLPEQWLWDMIDEFIYQFQSFCQYRAKLKAKSDGEIEVLKQRPNVWSIHTVLQYLRRFVDVSAIQARLLAEQSGVRYVNAGAEKDFGDHALYRTFGHFALIGLLRLNCMLGDYSLGLSWVELLDFSSRQTAFPKVLACHVTLFYYTAFAHMMGRRYALAGRTFAVILQTIKRSEYGQAGQVRSYQYDQIAKKQEQMYGLLAICQALCPQRLEDNINQTLREKYGEKLQRMKNG